jgi:hypothetical protein
MSSGVEALQLLRHEFESTVHDSFLGRSVRPGGGVSWIRVGAGVKLPHSICTITTIITIIAITIIISPSTSIFIS